ncbi:pentapeptide repeat-containing protein [Cytobacillus firmus]|uniref:Pentapeptide repeat-containing protein n=1 Tax=Cytobacillus firmus DS1 TaxID=1307436 RepID=W7L7P5_CYTFI|nr:pentapeptide repeat-containing protein [Cytobacillus firmus]EWG11287.1 pentapeptide repeat-containing protein [Cytobacillus firmus DS1]
MSNLFPDCENCFGLCCVALPYTKSADFAMEKDAGKPCPHLQADFRCQIHADLRKKGFRGCTTFECFGAGQKVSQHTFKNRDWRSHPGLEKEMFDVFPVMHQLHEMLFYLTEILHLEDAGPIHGEVRGILDKTEDLTNMEPGLILAIDVQELREEVNKLLLKASEIVRRNSGLNHKSSKNNNGRRDFIGAKLRGEVFCGANLRGSLFIAADLHKADLRNTDLIGADFRDADLSGANLMGSIFLTQAQVNSAKGDMHTKLPKGLQRPEHWVN